MLYRPCPDNDLLPSCGPNMHSMWMSESHLSDRASWGRLSAGEVKVVERDKIRVKELASSLSRQISSTHVQVLGQSTMNVASPHWATVIYPHLPDWRWNVSMLDTVKLSTSLCSRWCPLQQTSDVAPATASCRIATSIGAQDQGA